MAAINFTPISLYYSTTAAAVPSAGNLVAGELALNTLDEKLYFKNSAGTVKLLASNATSAPVLSFSAGTTGLTPATATTGAVTLAGTLANTNGGTGATAAFTQYGITYASSTTVLATTAAGTSTTVLHGNASGAPTFGAVSLTADVSGVLPTANGGTNLSSFTANGVVYASSSSALATGSAFNFNGTKVSIGTTEANRALNAYELNNTAYTTASFWNLDYAGIFVRNTSTTTNTLAGIGFSGGTSGNSISGIANILESVNAGALGFYTGGASAGNTVPERMRIASDGSVGIGTNAPATKLNISGTTAQTVMVSNTSTSLVTGDSMGNLDFAAGTANTTNARISGLVVGTSEAGGTLVIETRSDGGSLAERARIDSVGNVLVGGTAARGTTVGTAHLDLFNGTAPAGTLTNGVSLYSSSGDLKFMDAAGNAYSVGYRNVPQSGATKTSSYTLTTADVGEYIQVGASGSIVVPDATFSVGDVVSIFNNTSGNITMTMSITTAYIGGTDSDKATITLATRGVATILFISGTLCVVSGNVS